MKRVRMLADMQVDGLQYKTNQIVDFPDAIAKTLTASNPEQGLTPQADASAAGIEYCARDLKAEPIVHEEAAERSAKAAFVSLQAELDAANGAVDAETDAGRRAELKKVAKAAAQALADAKAKAKAAN